MTRSSFSNGIAQFFSGTGIATLQDPLCYSFSLEKGKTCRMDGLTVNVDADGAIWGAQYDTGQAVRHNERYTMAKGVNSALWLGDGKGMWHPLD